MGKNSYSIIKKDNPKVKLSSGNSRELKRRIKSGKYKDFSEGIYLFINPKGKPCFQVNYKTIPTGKSKKGKVKLSKSGKPLSSSGSSTEVLRVIGIQSNVD